MTIQTERSGGELTVSLSGRLDTSTAPELSELVKTSLSGVTSLVFDFSELEYVSSAGLRVLLTAYKAMRTQGTMKLRGVGRNIMEIFQITGLCDVLTVE